ncbi:sorting nexin-14 isoform X1 [Tribolium castaneum]|uniref:sorting nexin-14 isoform X1 n=1 Tax=Tribolium castaneum TaxID=7070 RepID=UPI0030FF0F3A
MIHKDIFNIVTLIANDKYSRFAALAVTIFSAFVTVFVSSLAGVIIYGGYILGCLVSWCFLKYQIVASAYLSGLVSFCYGSHSSRKKLKQSCSICDDLSCKRHQQNKAVAPWKDLYIPKELNCVIETFYNKILESFVISWYGQFTSDVDFLNELRYCLQYASAAVINQFLNLDHANVISRKLLPCVVKHIDDYMYMQQIIKLKKTRLNDVIVEYLGTRLHAATVNRKCELKYLQHLSSSLMPHILPDKYLKCQNYVVLIREILAGWVLLPLMDVLADPNIINSLVILAATYRSNQTRHKQSSEKVIFLENFIANNQQKSSFATDLNTIKGNTELLYAFVQFLKREEHVHLLQFCLDVDEFNNKLLTPDLTKKQLEELHSEALTLYKEYLNKNTINFIGCSDEIIDNYYSLLKDGVYNVAKLRTSKPLYQAYEHTFNVLEKVWCPSFFHSNEFYSYICGAKVTAAYNKGAASRSLVNFGSPLKSRRKYYETPSQGTVAKISSGIGKLRGALKVAQPIEGAIHPPEAQGIENGAVEDIIISECGNIFRDLSSWRVSILSYQTNNKVVSFCINVQRLDVVEDVTKRHWIVLRKDQDFYTLKAKLVEFHGENEISDTPLPSRKAGSSIEVRMKKYEEFLTKLLQKPLLRGSDLLFSFLTAEEDFTVLIATSTQNAQDFGNIYQSVAHKLRKEKGQHLDPFMGTFLLSTGKTKSGKFEWAEIGDEVSTKMIEKTTPMPKTFRNHVFNDNFGTTFKDLKESCNTSFNPIGMIQCIFYLLKYVFKLPHYLLRLYAAICSVAQEAVEAFSSAYIERRLKHSLSPSNLTYLVQLLEDVIFHSRTSPTKEELIERRNRAFALLNNAIPSYLECIVGKDVNEGLKMLLEILQHPHYNKHLAYNLLDLILCEMYLTLQNTGTQ